MTRQRQSERVRPSAGAAIVGLGLAMLLGGLDGGAVQVSHMLGAAAGEALGVLPCVVLAAWQALQTCVFDHGRLLQGLLPMLVSCWPLLLVIF